MTKDFSFSKINAQDQLEKTKHAFNEYIANPVDEALADSLAEKIWNCTDYFHRAQLCGCGKSKLSDCQERFRSTCKSLSAINDICDSVKHSGGYSRRDYSFKDFKTPALIVEFRDGSSFDFEIIVREAISYLEKLAIKK